MKKKLLLFGFILSCVSLFSQQQKVVGYLPYYRFGLIDEIEFDKLSHLCIAFANPNAAGDLDLGGQDIQPVVDAAHEEDVVVLLSLAGGALTAEWAAAWAELIKVPNRSAFIHKIMNYLENYQLEGADVDLEWSHVDDNYSGFVLELRDSIDAHGMLMTAALPGTYRYPQITDEAMHAYDFINLMAYDLTGSWAPDNPGPHSPYSFAEASIEYWMDQGMEGDKLTLGLPFYGYDFTNSSNVTSFTFGSMVAEDASYAWLDQVGLRYYNGLTTIQLKTELAMDLVSGVCIWEIGQDSFDEYSLLNAVFERINGTVQDEEILKNSVPLIFPNPVSDRVNIINLQQGDQYVRLLNANGQLIKEWALSEKTGVVLNLGDVSAGAYFLAIQHANGQSMHKIMKGW